MGNLTLENIRADSQFRAQRTMSDTDTLDRLINAVILDIAATDIPFPELDSVQAVTTVISQIPYNLPTRWYFYRKEGGRILSPTDYRGRVLPMTYKEYLSKTDYDTDATPTHYLHNAGQLLLYPSPDQVFSIELPYRVKPTILTAGNKTQFGEEWDEAVVLGVIAKLYAAYQEVERALAAGNEYIAYIRRRTPQADQEGLSRTPLGIAWEESDLV